MKLSVFVSGGYYFKLSLDWPILKVFWLVYLKFVNALFYGVTAFLKKLKFWLELFIASFTRFSKTYTSDYLQKIWDFILFSGVTYSIYFYGTKIISFFPSAGPSSIFWVDNYKVLSLLKFG